jgi:hypothetical protein
VPFGFDPKSRDRLRGKQMNELMFGHTIAGHVLEFDTSGQPIAGTSKLLDADFKRGVPWSVTTASDGSEVSYTWGEGGNSGGHIHFEGDRNCYAFDIEKACAVIFRNPTGRREMQNEYFWLHNGFLIGFSIAK